MKILLIVAWTFSNILTALAQEAAYKSCDISKVTFGEAFYKTMLTARFKKDFIVRQPGSLDDPGQLVASSDTVRCYASIPAMNGSVPYEGRPSVIRYVKDARISQTGLNFESTHLRAKALTGLDHVLKWSVYGDQEGPKSFFEISCYVKGKIDKSSQGLSAILSALKKSDWIEAQVSCSEVPAPAPTPAQGSTDTERSGSVEVK